MQAAVHHNSSDSDTIANTTLSSVQAQVIAALAQGRTITAAAQDAGIHRTTIHHWFRHEPVFKTAFQKAQREYSETLHDGMRELAARAVDTLRSLLDDPNTPPAIRLRTALAIRQRQHVRVSRGCPVGRGGARCRVRFHFASRSRRFLLR